MKKLLFRIVFASFAFLFSIAIVVLVYVFPKIIGHFESLRQEGEVVWLTFVAGIEYGGLVVVLLLFIVLCLKLVFRKTNPK